MSINEEIARHQELRLHIWKAVALNLLRGCKDDPYVIKTSEIEGHRGRRDKAIRLLQQPETIKLNIPASIEYVGFGPKPQYGNSEKIYRVLDFQDSKNFEQAPSPDESLHWSTYTSDIQRRGIIADLSDIYSLGNFPISSLNVEEICYVYWHQEEFDINTDKLIAFYKGLQTERLKAIMRAGVESEMNDFFPAYISEYLGYKQNTLSEEKTYDISFRNFARYPEFFYQNCFTGSKGFLPEYERKLHEFETLYSMLKTFHQKVLDAGGFEEVLKHFRKTIISKMLKNAPLSIGVTEERYNNKFDFNSAFFQFVIANSHIFNYEELYENIDLTKIRQGRHPHTYGWDVLPEVFEGERTEDK